MNIWDAIKNGLSVAKGAFDNPLDLLSEYSEKGNDLLLNGYQNPDQRNESAVSSLLGTLSEDNALDVQSQIVNSGLTVTPDQQKVIDEFIARENTNSARDYEEYMRDTDLLSSASQLSSLGLSPSSLSGSTVSHSGVGTTASNFSNPSLSRYEQKQAMARQLIAMVGSMANSGIRGASLASCRHLAGSVASSAAHSAYKITHWNR